MLKSNKTSTNSLVTKGKSMSVKGNPISARAPEIKSHLNTSDAEANEDSQEQLKRGKSSNWSKLKTRYGLGFFS